MGGVTAPRTAQQMLVLADDLRGAASSVQQAVVELMGPMPTRDPIVSSIHELARQADAKAGELFVAEARDRQRNAARTDRS